MKIKELFLISLITVTSMGNIASYAQNQEAQTQETWGNWLGRQKERYKQAATQWIPTDACFKFEHRDRAPFYDPNAEAEALADLLKFLFCIVATPTGAITGVSWQLIQDGYGAISDIVNRARNKLISPAQANNQIKEVLAKVKAEAEAHREEQHEL